MGLVLRTLYLIDLIADRLTSKIEKNPTLVIFWADNSTLLTYKERKGIEQTGRVVSLTPHEVLLEDVATGRQIVIRKKGDRTSPPIRS